MKYIITVELTVETDYPDGEHVEGIVRNVLYHSTAREALQEGIASAFYRTAASEPKTSLEFKDFRQEGA